MTDPFAPAGATLDGPDPFGAPAPRADKRPRMIDLVNYQSPRLMLVRPLKLETVPNRLSKEVGATQERLTADVIVLDGGPLAYGGAPEKMPPIPHTKSAPVPFEIKGMWITNVGIVSQCSAALAKRGMVLGRLSVGELSANAEPGWNRPYVLIPPTEQDKVIARTYLSANPADPFA